MLRRAAKQFVDCQSSSGHLKKLLEIVVNKEHDKYHMPGVVVGLSRMMKHQGNQRSKNVTWENAVHSVGEIRAGSGEPFKEDTLIRLDQCGGPIIALMLEDLLEKRQKFSWGTKLSHLFPSGPKELENITLIDLMIHQAGMDDPTMLYGFRPRGNFGNVIDTLKFSARSLFKDNYKVNTDYWQPYFTQEQELATLKRQERIKLTRYAHLLSAMDKLSQDTHEPEECFTKSKIGLAMAAFVGEQLTKKSLEQLIENVGSSLDLKTLEIGNTTSQKTCGHIERGGQQLIVPDELNRIPEIISALDIRSSMQDWIKLLSTHLLLARTNKLLSPMFIKQSKGYKVAQNENLIYPTAGGWLSSKFKEQKKSSHKIFEQKSLPMAQGLFISDKSEHDIILNCTGENGTWSSTCALDIKHGVAVAVACNSGSVDAFAAINTIANSCLSLASQELSEFFQKN